MPIYIVSVLSTVIYFESMAAAAAPAAAAIHGMLCYALSIRNGPRKRYCVRGKFHFE